jgi:hypothetical protein
MKLGCDDASEFNAETNMEPRVPQKAVNFVNNRATIDFLKMTLLHEVRFCFVTYSELLLVSWLIKRGAN